MRARAWAGLIWLGWLTLAACTAPGPVPTTASGPPSLPPAPRSVATALPTAPPLPEGPPAVAPAAATAGPTSVGAATTAPEVPPVAPAIPVSTKAATPLPEVPTAEATIAPTEVSTPVATATTTIAALSLPTACRETQGRLSVAHLASTVLARRVAYAIYLPPCYDRDPTRSYPTL